MRGVSYRWIDKGNSKGTEIGVIAQEVEKVVPEVVSEDREGIKSVSYGKLVGVLIEATKELRAEKDAEIAAINAENKQLRQNQQEIVQKQQLETEKLTSLNMALEARLDTLEDMFLAMSATLPKDKLAMHTQAELDEVQKTIQ